VPFDKRAIGDTNTAGGARWGSVKVKVKANGMLGQRLGDDVDATKSSPWESDAQGD
jgi:hypothetical protein